MHNYQGIDRCIAIFSNENIFWLFFNQRNIYMHFSRVQSVTPINNICDFSVSDFPNLFLALDDGKLNAYSLNPLKLNFFNPLPLISVEVHRTTRNVLAYPYEKPKYIVFTST
jgi:hypothetical protein